MIRIGKISYWHVHAWEYTNLAQEHPDTQIVAVWDEDAKRGQEAADRLGVSYVQDLEEMLRRDDLDAVIVDAPTNRHQEVITAAARTGKHIFTEKVLAPTVREAKAILEEIEKNQVKLMVSLPRLYEGYTLAIRNLIEQGLLGRITLVRVRLSHNGAIAGWLPEHFYSLEQCAGGAMIDLGCHPMYLTRLFLGEQPVSVQSQYSYITGKEVEDNAAAVLLTEAGAIGIVEAGFVNAYSPFTIEVHGTDGTLMYGMPEAKLLLRTSRLGEAEQQGWVEQKIPSRPENAFNQWVSHIQQDTYAEDNNRIAYELTQLMEASNQSAREHRAIRLSE